MPKLTDDHREHYRNIIEYAVNEDEIQILRTLIDTDVTQRKLAKEMGMTKDAVHRRIKTVEKRAAMHGWSPMHDMTKKTPETHMVKGTSTLYDDLGNVRLQWVKTHQSLEEAKEIMAEMVQAMKEDIRPIKQPRLKQRAKEADNDIIPWIQIGDGHIGMMANELETTRDFGLQEAEEELCTAILALLDRLPAYERVVINDLGDFTHAENMEGVTSASGNPLDMAGTFQQMIRSAIRIMRFIVHACLERFQHVDLIVNQGNHSRTNDFWTAELFHELYRDCDRLTVLNNGSVFIPYRMGNTLVMTHHSDKCRPADLSRVMMCDYPEDFGETTFRYIDIGHIHHKSVTKEFPGMTIESFNNLAPNDKWHHEKGYRSRSSVTIVKRSKTYGEVGREVMPIEQVRDIILKRSGKPGYFETKRPTVHTV